MSLPGPVAACRSAADSTAVFVLANGGNEYTGRNPLRDLDNATLAIGRPETKRKSI
jgi:hypothetical protein